MRIKKTLGAAATSLGLVVGLAGFAGATSGDITDTGPDSSNVVKSDTSQRVRVENNNHLGVQNSNTQRATTGDARSNENTSGGDASTGAASNDNSLSADVTVDNGASTGALTHLGGGAGLGDSSATINQTGPDSVNRVTIKNTSDVKVQNNNDLHITNNNHQTATSGDARVTDNTEGGSATTGDASNSNSSSFTFNVSN